MRSTLAEAKKEDRLSLKWKVAEKSIRVKQKRDMSLQLMRQIAGFQRILMCQIGPSLQKS